MIETNVKEMPNQVKKKTANSKPGRGYYLLFYEWIKYRSAVSHYNSS